MLFTKSFVIAATAFASVSFAKPIFKTHSGAEVAARGAAVPQVAKRGLLGLPIGIPNTLVPDTVPAILVNLDTNLGSLMTGDLNGTVPSGDGGVVGVDTDIETIKQAIEKAQNLLSDATASLNGATGGAGSPLETAGALTNVMETVVALLSKVSGPTKGLTTRDLPAADVPVVRDLLQGLTGTLGQLIVSVLSKTTGGISSGEVANLDIIKALLVPFVASAAALLNDLGVDASPITGVVDI